jgi:hypothetical protein
MIDLNDVVDYKEKIIPAGKYEVEVVKSVLGVWGTGRPKIDLTCRIIDTIPSGMEIDYDEYADPIDQMVFPTVNLPVDNDNPAFKKESSEGFIKKLLKDYIKNFNVEIPEDPSDPDYFKEFAANFEEMVGGVVVKYEPSDRNNPGSDPRPVADRACAPNS